MKDLERSLAVSKKNIIIYETNKNIINYYLEGTFREFVN